MLRPARGASEPMMIVRWANGQRVQYNRAGFCKYLSNPAGAELYEKKNGAWIATIFGGNFAVEAIEACSARPLSSPDLTARLERAEASLRRARATIKRLRGGS